MIDTGQSYTQRVVKAGVAALGYEKEAEGSHHLAYEKVVLSPATARDLGYEVSEEAESVKVSGRKGLGVKADDLLDALLAKARAEVDARDPERDPAAREATAAAVATGALRYFMLRFSRTRIITFDMEEALAFTGETGPYVQNAVVRARNIFGKLEDAGTPRRRAPRLAPWRPTWAPPCPGEEGDEVWSLLLLMARTEDVEEQAIRGQDVALVAKHAFAVAQAFHSYYQKPQHSVLHAETDELRAFRDARRGHLRPADGDPAGSPGDPGSGTNVMRPLIGITLDDEHGRPGLHVAPRRLRSLRRAGGGGPGDHPSVGPRHRLRDPRPPRRAAPLRRRRHRPRALRPGSATRGCGGWIAGGTTSSSR